MVRCSCVTGKNSKCKREATNGLYCWQHVNCQTLSVPQVKSKPQAKKKSPTKPQAKRKSPPHVKVKEKSP